VKTGSFEVVELEVTRETVRIVGDVEIVGVVAVVRAAEVEDVATATVGAVEVEDVLEAVGAGGVEELTATVGAVEVEEVAAAIVGAVEVEDVAAATEGAVEVEELAELKGSGIEGQNGCKTWNVCCWSNCEHVCRQASTRLIRLVSSQTHWTSRHPVSVIWV